MQETYAYMLEFCSKSKRELRISVWQSGYSLAELMVTVGIGAVLLVSLVSALLMQESSNIQLRQSLEASEVENEVRLILGDSDACRATVGTGMPPPDNPASPPRLMRLLYADGTEAIRAPRTYSNLVRLDYFELKRALKPAGAPLPGAAAVGGRWHYDLIMNFTPLSGTTHIRPRSVELYVEVDRTTGLITGCEGRVMQANYDCRTQSATTGGRSITVSCDTIPGGEYRVVSCGMADQNPDKNDWRRMVPKHTSAPNGCWCYDHDAAGSLRCQALCCRY